MAENKEQTAAKPAKKKKDSFWHGVKQEWNKIIWTPKEDLGRRTGLVIFISLVLGVIIALIDQGALQLVKWIVSI